MKIRLLYVIYSMDNGGAETLAIRLAEKLSSDLFDILLCSLSDSGPLRDVLIAKGVRHISLGKKEGKDFGVAFRLRSLLKQERIDLVHTHNQGPLLYTYLATRLMRHPPKIVHTEHINMLKEFSYSRKHMMYNRLLYRSLDGFVNIAHHLTQSFQDAFNLSSAKVTTIHNSVDPGEYDFTPVSNLRAETGVSSDAPLVGCISALRRQKDHQTLINAMEIVRQRAPRAVLLLAGEGETDEELRRVVRQRKLDECVIFLGFRSDVASLLSQFDVFVLASLYEGLPLCILEAMAAGKPVVATDADGTNELIRDGVTGLLVPLRDPEKLAKAILFFLENPEKAEEIAAVAKTFVERDHNFNTMIHNYEEYYCKVMGQTAG